MKKCPACGEVYSDDTLDFCGRDGTTLTSNSVGKDQYYWTKRLSKRIVPTTLMLLAVLFLGFCAYVAFKPVNCPIHNVGMHATGRIEEIPPLSGHTYEWYSCPQGHEVMIDQCPRCTSRGDDEFQEKEIEKRLK